MRATLLACLTTVALAACSMSKDDSAQTAANDGNTMTATDAAQPQAGDALAANDPAPGQPMQAGDDQPRPVMQLQVVLDRLGFSPGVIDGKMGMSTELALKGFQEANNLQVTGKFDNATKQALAPRMNIAATRMVTLPAEFVSGPFTQIPDDAEQQAKLDRMGYKDVMEKLGERFHTTPDTLRDLNGPQTQIAGGSQIRVPNVGNDRVAKSGDEQWAQTLRTLGVSSEQPKATKVVVDKSDKSLKAFGADGKLLAQFQATMGSTRDPLPLGDWKVLGVAKNTPFNYNPELFWDVSDSKKKVTLPPGPNGPVGVVWIDLSKEHYGIHGTPAPETIGRAESHGCVRLTNWDAARLAQMVSSGTEVLFQA